MGAIIYDIMRYGEGWTLLRNDERAADYASSEAAFEAVAAQVLTEMRSGDEILIRVRAALDPEMTSPGN